MGTQTVVICGDSSFNVPRSIGMITLEEERPFYEISEDGLSVKFTKWSLEYDVDYDEVTLLEIVEKMRDIRKTGRKLKKQQILNQIWEARQRGAEEYFCNNLCKNLVGYRENGKTVTFDELCDCKRK